MTTGTPRKPPVFGPEPWSELAGLSWSHWDLWFAVVAVSDHDASLDELEAHLVAELRRHAGRQGPEAKLSHLADLRSRFEGTGLIPSDLATPEVLADTRVLARARKKVDDDWVEGRAMTPAMVETPRVRLVRQAAGLRVEDYWADLCDLVVFEDYALGFQEETLPWRAVPAGQAALIEGILLTLAAECRSHYLDHQADEALQQVAWLAVGGRRFGHYVEAAARLGSDHWMPIEAMAESALRSGRRELAVAVFRAADRPGFHQEHLRQRCRVLTGVDVDDEKHDSRLELRVVEARGGHS